MKTFSIISNGCEALQFDGNKVAEKFHQRGIKAATNGDADIRVILGCTFTQRQENGFRGLVEDAAGQSRDGQLVIVSGCFLKDESCEGVIFTRKESVGDVLDKLLADERIDKVDTPPEAAAQTPFVAISEGCYGNCTFCSVRFVRGRHRSRPIHEVVSDVERVAKRFGKAKLVGQEIAAYGKDIGTTLPELIKKLFDLMPALRLELGSLGAVWMKRFSDEDLAVFADQRIEGNIHLPLQSASNEVLRRMSRANTFEQFLQLHAALKKCGLQRFSTDLIAGFPGETESDHEKNLAFLEANRLRFAQIFMYEPRPGTSAADMEQIPRETRVRRTLELIGAYVAGYEGFGTDESSNIDDILNTNIKIEEEEVIPCEG